VSIIHSFFRFFGDFVLKKGFVLVAFDIEPAVYAKD